MKIPRWLQQLKPLASRRIPDDLLSVGPNSPKTRMIEIDFPTGMPKAIDHLTALGHKKSGVISGPIKVGSAATTRDAFLTSLAKRNLHAERVIECDSRADGGMSAVGSLLNQNALPTALLCGNDWIANRRDPCASGSKSPGAGRHICDWS